MALLYGAMHAGSGIVVSALAMNVLVSVADFTYSQALFAMGDADVHFKVNFAALFSLLTLGRWLVRARGPLGVAHSLMMANIAA